MYTENTTIKNNLSPFNNPEKKSCLNAGPNLYVSQKVSKNPLT